jgi:hypothetical protein
MEFSSNLSIMLLLRNFILLYFVCINFYRQNNVVLILAVLEGLNFFRIYREEESTPKWSRYTS